MRVQRGCGCRVGKATGQQAANHVSGLLRDPRTYEALDPAAFGRQWRILLGKHAGSASLRDAPQGLDIPQAALPDLLARLRAHSERVKRRLRGTNWFPWAPLRRNSPMRPRFCAAATVYGPADDVGTIRLNELRGTAPDAAER